MKVICGSIIALALMLASTRASAVEVQRSGAENPMVEVAKSTIYGSLTGLVLGGAIALASNGDNDGEIVKWSFVSGTFFGFGYGLYHVTSRPRPAAMLELKEGTVALRTPAITVVPGGTVRVRLVGTSF